MNRNREGIPSEDRWNVEALYASHSDWENAFLDFSNQAQLQPAWTAIQAYQGTFSQGPENVKQVLDLLMSVDRELAKLYTYAHLRHDEDIANPLFKKSYEQVLNMAHAFGQETSWIQPELVELDENILNSYLDSPVLTAYRFYLEKMIRVKKHTLSNENEKILAWAGQALQTSYKAFNAISDADFKFGSVKDSQGNEKILSHASYGLYIRDQDRTLRKNAFKQYHLQYSNYENTLCELLAGQVQNHIFQARSRNYSSSLEAALFPKNIPTTVYHSLIQAVNEKITVLHRYMDLRKKILGLDEMHLYDIYVPLTNTIDIKLTYQEAENIVIESVAPLGPEYQTLLATGLKDQRWVDRYENLNKRSGAYSSGCFDSMPYILMNYKNLLRDVFTLAHEAGHSMHSLYSRRAQPYQYSDYPIFLAEVASTFNEDLLTRLLIERCEDPYEKIFLLNQKIEDIRGTLFRQTMFAEFEFFIHHQVEQGNPLTTQFLKQAYRDLNHKYFGPSVIIDDEIDIEWSRIPHFYYNYYVFQYATGVSAAVALTEKVVKGKEKDREDYLNFLKGGSSMYPIDMLKMAGIDMESPLPVKAAIQKFEELLDELEQVLLPLNT
ncbi:MAG: oligoendopeptidase F [Candidatus Protochlamydia sp.]|nr:oligoendopeptidase F [Candidatus Protochlamydia sp.]